MRRTDGKMAQCHHLEAKVPVSILIPTRNEERNLAECLEAVSWAEDIVVFDSFSADRTEAIARAAGARFIQRRFDNFSSHKNWALEHVPFLYPWVLIVDADERIPLELAQEIKQVFDDGPKYNGYYIARRNWFAGRPIRYGGWYPNWQMRLIRRGFGKYEDRIVHEHVIIEGPPGFLRTPLIHYDYKGIERYFERHNVYSSMEAVEAYRSLTGNLPSTVLPGSTKAGAGRRRAMKMCAYRWIPARSLVKFVWMYIVRLGFLDGRIGFRFCLLHTFYEYQISLKMEELAKEGSPMREKYGQHLGRTEPESSATSE